MPDLPITAPGQRTNYRVQLAVFQGPLDLLLYLIEREELDITLISLARVTDQYMAYLETMEKLQVADLADFIVVAGRLLLLKSQALLPCSPSPVVEPETEDGDDLVRQLRLYKAFKKAAQHLDERQTLHSYVRMAPAPRLEPGLQHLEPVSLEALIAAAQRAMQGHPLSPPVGTVVSPFTLTIEDQINLIKRTLSHHPQIRFTQLLTVTRSRQEISVTLLAMLELIKRHRVQAWQEHIFGEIVILPTRASRNTNATKS